MELEEFYKLRDQLATHFTKERNKTITSRDVFDALFFVLSDKENLEYHGDLWDVNIDLEDAIKVLNDVDFNLIQNPIITDDYVFPEELFMEKKVSFKAFGQKWIIHKYDADPFPSNPHAHHSEQNIKLDLSNGKYYTKRRFMGKINHKDLLEIRRQAQQVFSGELPPLEK